MGLTLNHQIPSLRNLEPEGQFPAGEKTGDLRCHHQLWQRWTLSQSHGLMRLWVAGTLS